MQFSNSFWIDCNACNSDFAGAKVDDDVGVDAGVDVGVGGEDEGVGVGAVLSLDSPGRYKHVPAVFPNIQNPVEL